MIGIGDNTDISVSGKIKCNFTKLEGHHKTVKGNGYYMPRLGYNQLMSTKEYFRMEHGVNIIVTMDMTELILKPAHDIASPKRFQQKHTST